MSSVTTQNEIEYPESDGKPMGETDLHRDWMFRLLEIFRQRYRDQQVYIACSCTTKKERRQSLWYPTVLWCWTANPAVGERSRHGTKNAFRMLCSR